MNEIEERVSLDKDVPWDYKRCPAVTLEDKRCRNLREKKSVYYPPYEFCANHMRAKPKAKFVPNAEQLAMKTNATH